MIAPLYHQIFYNTRPGPFIVILLILHHIAGNQTLGSAERLKSRKIIEALFKEGRSVAVHPIRITYKIVDGQNSLLQAGFSVSIRNFKKAVDRNRVKRLLRESYRKQKAGLMQQLPGRTSTAQAPGDVGGLEIKPGTEQAKGLALFIIYTGKELPAYDLVDNKIKQALKKLADQLR